VLHLPYIHKSPVCEPEKGKARKEKGLEGRKWPRDIGTQAMADGFHLFQLSDHLRKGFGGDDLTDRKRNFSDHPVTSISPA
jgi:hypothetical protein